MAADGSVKEQALLILSKKLKAIHDADSNREFKIRRDTVIEYAINGPHSIGIAPDDVEWFSVNFVNLLVRRKRQSYDKNRKPGLSGQELADALESESDSMKRWLENLVDFYLGDGLTNCMIRKGLELLLETDTDTFEAPVKHHLQTEVMLTAGEIYANHPEELDWLLDTAPSLEEWAFAEEGESGGGSKNVETKE